MEDVNERGFDENLTQQIANMYEAIISGIGEDAHREGLIKTLIEPLKQFSS